MRSTTAVPSLTSGTDLPVIRIACGSASVIIHAPCGVMPTGTTSYLAGSSADSMLPADTTEIPCSLLRPP